MNLPKSIVAVLLLAALTTTVEAVPEKQKLPDFTKLAKANSPAVVNISTTTKPKKLGQGEGPSGLPMPDMPEDGSLSEFFRRFFGEEGPPGGWGGGGPRSSLGSGFLISKDGYVITNYHVVRQADEIIVRMLDRREYRATVIGTDPRSDIAVLKIEAEEKFPVVTLSNSDDLEVGEWVLAIGSPFGFDYSVTAGIVSAKGRSLPNENYVPFIQTDVAINPGNSGGPLFNLEGEVVGVNSQIYSRTGGFMGVSFSIPIQVVMNVYEQLREKGSVTRGWLGVLIQDITQELAESFDMGKPQGALVSRVLDDSPAKKAGIETGDVIVKFNKEHVESSSDLPPMVGTAPVGKKILVEVIRGGRQKKLTVVIGELPEDGSVVADTSGPTTTSSVDKKLQLGVADLNNQQRERFQISKGAVIVSEIKDGPAYDAGLRLGDVILQMNNHKVTGRKQFEKLISELNDGKTVPVLIQRKGGPLFLAMRVPSTAE